MKMLHRNFPCLLVLFTVLFAAGGANGQVATGGTPEAFTRTIYLVRHGAYDTTEKGDESVVNGLVPLGIAEARLTGARLRGLPFVFDSFSCSTFTRARQTAEIIGQSLPGLTLVQDPLLHEVLPRTRNAEAMKNASPAELDAAEAQLNQAFAKYFVPATDRSRHDLIIAHGNVIRYLVMKALGVDPQAWLQFGIAHCSITVIQVRSDGSMKVIAVGDSGHIPPDMISGLVKNDPQLVNP